MLLNNVEKLLLPTNMFVNESPGTQNAIVLHHTSGGTAKSSFDWWSTQKERVGTHFIIDRDGKIFQCVPLNRWIFHLAVGKSANRIEARFKTNSNRYDRGTIGIELASWGILTKKNNEYFTWVNRKIAEKDVAVLNKSYRGSQFYEKYTDAQLKSTSTLIKELIKIYPSIPLKDDYSDIFSINNGALEMRAGIYSHTSYRTDKSDVSPQENLIQMLNNLKK
jgi:N-acetyl-anhydromuramyl-L-alanine amidase AmpD